MFGAKIKSSIAASVIAAVLFFCACNKPAARQPEARLKVMASSYAAYAITYEVFKNIAAVQMLIPPGTEPHHFEPGPKTAAETAGADFFFFTSGRMEPWAMELSSGRGYALAYQLPQEGKDPHVWMSFTNTAKMAENIAAYAARKNPDLEPALARNTADFTRELQMLDRLFTMSLKNCQSRVIYHIGHNAFGYIALNYKLDFKPLIGAAFEGEPGAKQMALMIKEIKDKKIKYIFSEEALNPRLAQTIAAETGAQILDLYTIEHITKAEFEQHTTYKQFMVKNLNNLKKGLACESI